MRTIPRDVWKHHIVTRLSPIDVSMLRASSSFWRNSIQDTALPYRDNIGFCQVSGAFHGHDDVIRLLMRRGQICHEDATRHAARGGHRHIIELILTDTDPSIVYLRELPNSALVGAASGGQLAILEWILSMRHFSSYVFVVAVEEAAIHGHLRILQFLINKNHIVEHPHLSIPVMLDTSLHKAARHGHRDIINWALEKGCDIGVVMSGALFGKRADIVRFAIDHGSVIPDLETICRHFEDEDLLRLCIENGSHGSNDWDRALYLVAKRGMLGLAKVLLEHNDNNWLQAAAVAQRKGHRDIVDLLLDHGLVKVAGTCRRKKK